MSAFKTVPEKNRSLSSMVTVSHFYPLSSRSPNKIFGSHRVSPIEKVVEVDHELSILFLGEAPGRVLSGCASGGGAVDDPGDGGSGEIPVTVR